MIQIRPRFNSILEKYESVDRGNLYMLLYTRERTIRLLSDKEVIHPRVIEFIEWLKNRDKNYIQHLSGYIECEADIEESVIILCEAIYSSVKLPTHWWNGEYINRTQLIFELVEEESAFRGEISVFLGQ